MKKIVSILLFILFNIGGIDLNATPSQAEIDQWFKAAKDGNIDVIKSLKDKVDINVWDAYHNTALMYAVSRKNKELMKLLLVEGADLTKVNLHRERAEDIAQMVGIPTEFKKTVEEAKLLRAKNI